MLIWSTFKCDAKFEVTAREPLMSLLQCLHLAVIFPLSSSFIIVNQSRILEPEDSLVAILSELTQL